MKKIGPITGTFIDEITYDIPSSNWSVAQWKRDLDYMQDIGIDTLIMIRGGFGRKTVFPSKVLGTLEADDFAGLIFEETSKRKMDLFLGLYLSTVDWNHGDVEGEVAINKKFVNEVWEKYGEYPSFKGWYLPQETNADRLNFSQTIRELSAVCKDKAPDKQVLISPCFKTCLTSKQPFIPSQHYEEWDRIFERAGKDVDICAFQDGTAPFSEMKDCFKAVEKACKKHGVAHWVNVELFERDVRNMYYPISFSELKSKIKLHNEYAEKMISFEFSHFLSPQSIYPSAQNLNALYKDYYIK